MNYKNAKLLSMEHYVSKELEPGGVVEGLKQL